MFDCLEARWWADFSDGCGYATYPDVSFENASVFDYRPDLDRSGNAS